MSAHKALILLSHGSVLCGAARAAVSHATHIRESGEFACVEVGFLNYSKPSLAEALASCVCVNVKEIVIVPYFLVPGHFARKVVQEALDASSFVHEEIRLTIGEPIGYDSRLASALLRLAELVEGPETWHTMKREAMEACSENPRCPLYKLPGCKAEVVVWEAK